MKKGEERVKKRENSIRGRITIISNTEGGKNIYFRPICRVHIWGEKGVQWGKNMIFWENIHTYYIYP